MLFKSVSDAKEPFGKLMKFVRIITSKTTHRALSSHVGCEADPLKMMPTFGSANSTAYNLCT
eukprot:4866238-Prymnesium_polylepis.1